MGIWHSHVGHVDLVELGLASDLAQRSNFHAVGMHVKGEVGHPLVLRGLRVCASDKHPEISKVCKRVPHLLAVDDPLVAVTHGSSSETGKIRTKL